eukprot:9911288-Prorocentrum_lima.AAC.1
MTLLSLVHNCPMTMHDILRGVGQDETPDVFDVMASYEEWVFFERQKDQDPSSSLSALTDE